MWLGTVVAGRPAIRGERWAVVDERRLPRPVRRVATSVTTFGYPWMYFPLAFLIAAECRRRGIQGGTIVPASAGVGWAVHRAIKTCIHRDRPPSQRGQSNYRRAYPSGHTAGATAVATATAYLLWRGHQPMRRVLLVALLPPSLVGASRVILGKHWLTDVLGGWCTGIAAAAFVVSECARAQSARPIGSQVRSGPRVVRSCRTSAVGKLPPKILRDGRASSGVVPARTTRSARRSSQPRSDAQVPG